MKNYKKKMTINPFSINTTMDNDTKSRYKQYQVPLKEAMSKRYKRIKKFTKTINFRTSRSYFSKEKKDQENKQMELM